MERGEARLLRVRGQFPRAACEQGRGRGGKSSVCSPSGFFSKKKPAPSSVADCMLILAAPRQQLFQLVRDTPQIPPPLASSRRPAGSSAPGSWPVLKEEVPLIDSFFRKAEVCASAKADGLAGAVQEIFKTEEHHNPDSASAGADGRDDELGSWESPECAKGHEKPSTSLVKVVKKGETELLVLSWSVPQAGG